MRWLIAIAAVAVLAAPVDAAPCTVKIARPVAHAAKRGQVVGKLKHLLEKNGKRVVFNTSLADRHDSRLTLRWPAGVKPKRVHRLVLEVSAKKLMSGQTWSFELRDHRRKKWIPLGSVSWKDGGGDKSFALRTVDVTFYRGKRGRLTLRVRSEDVGELRADRLRLRLRCSDVASCCRR